MAEFSGGGGEPPSRRLLNRLKLGSGVACGLRLEAVPGGLVRLGPGVAFDEQGRELVVAEPVTFDPRQLTDDAGEGAGAIDEGAVTIALAASPGPAEGDPAGGSFVVLVLPAEGESARAGPDLCDLFAPPGPPPELSPGERLAGFLAANEGDCFADRCPAHVILGRVTLERCAEPTIDQSRDSGRRLVVSNSVLLDLVLCLWERVEADDLGGHPTPPPSWGKGVPKSTPPLPTLSGPYALVPHATPPPRTRLAAGPAPTGSGAGAAPAGAATALLQVVGVEFLDEWGGPQGALDRLIRPARFAAARGIGAIEVTFSKPLDPETCKAIEPATASILVRSDRGGGPDGHVPGTVSVQGNVARYQIDGGRATFPAGEYEVTLFGDEDPAGRRPAIAARDRSRLDGEARTLPSGDGREGGNFVFRLRIGDD